LGDTEGQRVDVSDQVRDGTTSIIWYDIAGFKNNCPVMKDVFVQAKDGQLGFRGIIKCRLLERLKNVLV
jgi:hypothetical protein